MAEVEPPCLHEVTIKDLCAVCGKDLRLVDRTTGERAEKSTAHVSMIHHVPELVVSKNLADEIGQKDYQQCLKARKLILLVDLDQTLIHTTNRPVMEKDFLPDIYRYKCHDGQYFTKLRPHCREFLERMSKLYEMHIVSFGQRLYAHQIAKILDEDGKFFEHRIMSRDELNSSRHKTNNINALFPITDQRKLIVIIDDRDDVWQFCDECIRVKPYKYFAEVDDINAPTAPPPKPQEKTDITDAGDPKNEEDDEKGEVKPQEEEDVAEAEKKEQTPPPVASSPFNQDNDDVLEDMGRVLTEVHKSFFERYDKTKEVTEMSALISYMRKNVLKDEVIALSGVIPIGMDKKRSIEYRLCVQFGATVVDDVTDKTTVLIAARPSTEKVRLAMKMKIPVVTSEWLFACTAKWISAPKDEYKPTGLNPSHFRDRRRQEEPGNRSPKLCEIEAISKADIKTMEEEVDKELEGLSDDSEDDAEEYGSDTSEEGAAAVEVLEQQNQRKMEQSKKEKEDQEEEDNDNSELLKKLKSGEDSDDDDQDDEMRNGDIESRRRKRTFESAGGTDDEDEPNAKRFSPQSEDGDDDNEAPSGNGSSDEDEDDALEAELEHQLNG